MNQEKKNNMTVTNGCSGKCCEKFTFKYTIKEINDMILAKEEGFNFWRDRNNIERGVSNSSIEELKQVRDMLIPLGESEICPKENKTFNEIHTALGWKKENITQEAIKNFIVHEGIISSLIFTCKHFDTQNKLCTIHDTKPLMCKNFTCQDDCHYEDCKCRPQ